MSELTLDPTLLNELAIQKQEQQTSHATQKDAIQISWAQTDSCLLYTSPSPRDLSTSRMPSSA